MSTCDGKYAVESEAERSRRELAEARGRLERVSAEAAALAAAAAAAAATYSDVALSPPAVPHIDSDDTEVLVRAADDLDAGVDRSRRELNAAVAAAEIVRLAAVASSLSPAAPEAASLSASGSRACSASSHATAPARDRLADITRVLSRLPGDCAPGVAAELDAAVSLVVLGASEAQADLALDSLRRLVQRESDLSRLRERNSSRLRSLVESLDGLTGAAVDGARSALAAVHIDRRLPAELGRVVAAARASAEREADQRFVLATIAQGLESQGYRVATDFIADVQREGAIAMMPDTDRHGVNVRVRAGSVLFNVVRLDEDGKRDFRADLVAEQRFCAITGHLAELARSRGCELNLQTANAVTPGKLQVVKRAPQRKDRSRRVDAQRERTRSRSGDA